MTNPDPGFRVIPGFFDLQELAPLVAELSSATLPHSRAGVRHLLRLPTVRELASDKRLLQLAREFIGSGAQPFRATLFDKSPTANWLVAWHQDSVLPVCEQIDSPAWGPWTVKAGVLHAHAPAAALAQVVSIRVHLDDSTSANGPLRVLPDTHKSGLLAKEEIESLATDIEPVECVVASGGVVMMRPLTVHASSKARESLQRRVVQIDYASRFDIEPGIRLAITQVI